MISVLALFVILLNFITVSIYGQSSKSPFVAKDQLQFAFDNAACQECLDFYLGFVGDFDDFFERVELVNAIITSINKNFGPDSTTNPILTETLPLFSTDDNTAPLAGADPFQICNAIDTILSSNNDDDNSSNGQSNNDDDAQLLEILRTNAIEQVINFQNNDRIIDAIFDCLIRNALPVQQNESDIAVSNYISNTVSKLLGSGADFFSSSNNFGAEFRPDSIAVSNFNGDRNLDLAVFNKFSNTISIFLGNGDGTFDLATNLH